MIVGERGELEPAVEIAASRIALAVGKQSDRAAALELFEARVRVLEQLDVLEPASLGAGVENDAGEQRTAHHLA